MKAARDCSRGGKMSPTDMNNNIDEPLRCQICSLPQQIEPLSTIGILWQFRNRLKSFIKRRFRYFVNLYSECLKGSCSRGERSESIAKILSLQPGEHVRIKSRMEIQQTLNRWNRLKGCAFMDEMWPYCGTEQRVMKRVEKFLDERDYRIKKCKGLVILEGLICQGTKNFGSCDRSCFYFWREEWLERLD
jgi:hypothetical protein